MELFFDWLSRAPAPASWALPQDLSGASPGRQTVRDIASMLGILALAGLWVYLAMHGNRRIAGLAVIGTLGLAYGAGYALGRESRLEALHAGVSQLILFLELLIDVPRGLNAAARTAATFIVTGIAAMAAGSALALSLSNAGPAGEVIVELLLALFF